MNKTAIFTYQPRESTIDYEGHLSLLMFTKGCNFCCGYCHNPELIPETDETLTFAELKDVLRFAKDNWIDAISITGGEPTMNNHLVETLEFIKREGFLIKLDTQGSFPETLKKSLPYLDYVAMDYKMPLNSLFSLTHTKIDKELIRKSLDLLKNSGKNYEIRTTVVPGIHTEDVMIEICKELNDVEKYVLQSFIPRDNLPDQNLRTVPRTSRILLEEYSVICSKYLKNVQTR
ncbi:MAG: anaerobic ribonucleoside-triphosphate reductase activating protein [Caldisericia bacterium]|nr:anaerobic ribonucleoside-triphosphate reductase activating protein [Caldisericia bacterium]